MHADMVPSIAELLGDCGGAQGGRSWIRLRTNERDPRIDCLVIQAPKRWKFDALRWAPARLTTRQTVVLTAIVIAVNDATHLSPNLNVHDFPRNCRWCLPPRRTIVLIIPLRKQTVTKKGIADLVEHSRLAPEVIEAGERALFGSGVLNEQCRYANAVIAIYRAMRAQEGAPCLAPALLHLEARVASFDAPLG